jgi:hypothetical protein
MRMSPARNAFAIPLATGMVLCYNWFWAIALRLGAEGKGAVATLKRGSLLAVEYEFFPQDRSARNRVYGLGVGCFFLRRVKGRESAPDRQGL